MPLVDIEVIEGVFDEDQKAQMIEGDGTRILADVLGGPARCSALKQKNK